MMARATERPLLAPWLPWLGAGAAAIVLLYVVHTALGEPSWQIYQLFNLDGEANIVSWFGSFLWALAAVAAHGVAVRVTVIDRRAGRTWRLMTALLIFLSCDEIAMLHERWSEMISRRVWGGHLWLPEAHWVLLFGPFILLALVWLGRRLRQALSDSVAARRCLVLGAALFAGGAMGVELLLNAIPLDAPKLLFQMQIVIEEAMEMAGALCILTGLLAHQRRLTELPSQTNPLMPLQPRLADLDRRLSRTSPSMSSHHRSTHGVSPLRGQTPWSQRTSLPPLTHLPRPALVVCVIDDLGRGGAQRQLVELARGLDRRRFDLRVIALSTEKVAYHDALRALGVPVALIAHRGTFSLATLLEVRRLLRQWQPSLVQTWLFTADFYGRLAARWAGVPAVLSAVRSPEPDKPWRYVAVDRWLARWTDAIVANAACTVDVFRRRERVPERKLRVVYNGVDAARFDPARVNGSGRSEMGLEPSSVVIGSVGRLEPVKRYGDLVEAFGRIAGCHPRARLCFIGEGTLRETLQAQAQRLGLAERVRMAGATKPEGIAERLAAIDIFVLPSEYEGCSNAILEAMAMGKPVIATDVGGNRELLGDATGGGGRGDKEPGTQVWSTAMSPSGAAGRPVPGYEVVECGILVRKGDVEGLTAAITALLDDPQMAHGLGARGRHRVAERFTTARMVQEMASIYEEWIFRSSLSHHDGDTPDIGRRRGEAVDLDEVR